MIVAYLGREWSKIKMMNDLILFVPDVERFVVFNRFMYCYAGLIVILSVWKYIEDCLDNS